jgi:hypothetical protein
MGASFEKQIDRVHNACYHPIFQRINDFLEKTFYRIGEFIGIYAPLVCAFVSIGVLLLGLGLLTAEGQSDIYKLWINSNSRLIGERKFVQDHFAKLQVRQQFLLGLPIGDDNQVFQEKYLDEYYQLHKGYTKLIYDDPKYGPQGIEDVCGRSIESLQPVRGLFRLYGLKGFPCNRVTPLDCFSEGAYNFNIPPDVWANLFPTRPFNSVYASRKSFYNTTLEDNLKLASSQDQCTMWAGSRFPEGFMWGGITRANDSDISSPIVEIKSLQLVYDLKTPEQLANQRCFDNRSTNVLHCRDNIIACMDPGLLTGATTPSVNNSCLWHANNDFAVTCATPIATNATICPNVTQCAQDACLVDTAPLGYCSKYPVYNATSPGGVLCNVCTFPELIGAVNASARCTSCKNACALYGVTQPGTTCAAKFNECLQPLVKTCAAGCIAQGSTCETDALNYCNVNTTDAEVSDAKKSLLGWEDKWLEFAEGNKTGTYLKCDYYSGRTTDDLVAEAGAADGALVVYGYLFMIGFASVVLLRPDNALLSKVTLGLVGMGLVIISVLGGMGLSALAGIPFSPTVTQVLPFLAIGLGVQDMFVFAFTWQFRPNLSTTEQTADLMRDAGLRNTLTSFVNLVAFSIGSAIPLPAVSQLSSAAALVVLINWITVFFAHGALIAMNARRTHMGKRDIFCCWNTTQAPKDSAVPPVHVAGPAIKCGQCLMWTPVRISILVMAVVVFALGLWGSESIQVGLPLQDIVPASSYAHGFLTTRDEYYGAYKSYLVTGFLNDKTYTLNYTDKVLQKKIMDMESKLDPVFGMDPTTPVYSTSIFDRFYRWFNLQLRAGPADAILAVTGAPAAFYADPDTTSLNLTLYMTASSGAKYQVFCTQCSFVQPQYFELLLHLWLSTPDGISSLEQVERDYNFNPPKILSFHIVFVQGTVRSDEDAVRFIVGSRKVTDNAGVPLFPSGFVYDLYEQYVDVNKYLSDQMGYISIGVFFAAFVFLYHPGAVIIMCLNIALITSEIYGFLYFFKLKMNGVCVINLVFSLATSVAFNAHISRLFLITPGTRVERAQIAVAKMIFPIGFSAFSTFIGVFPLNFAKFPYFILYFFDQFVLLLVLGVFNGLLVLPVVLSFIGPPPLASVSKDSAHANEVELPALEEGEEETT